MKTLLLAGVSALALAAGTASAGTLPMVMKSSHAAFHFTPPKGSTVLYDQSNSSGWSSYAIASVLLESSGYAVYDSQGADDFTIPGTATHRITAVYAPGQNAYGSGYTAANFQVTFYKKLKASPTKATVKVLATCASMPASAVTADGYVLIDVSSCGVRARGSHDYSVSLQAITPSGLGEENWWYWQTNETQIRQMGLWTNYGGGFELCDQGHYAPMKYCFPTSGIGPDLAFAIIGK